MERAKFNVQDYFWSGGWLWGRWGLLLGVPILMAVKSVCDRIDDLKPVGELLGT